MKPAGHFLGVPLASGSADDLIHWLTQRPAPDAAPRVVAYLNAHTTNLAGRDPAFRDVLASCDLVYADGMAVVWAARMKGLPVVARLSAADYFRRFCWAAAAKGLRLGLLGGEPGVAQSTATALAADTIGLPIAFARPGHLPSPVPESLWRELAAARPDVLLVGMGSPRQERFALQARARRIAPTIWCVGALFEYFSGTRRRAPAWMCEAGLEWAYRLSQEPGRLAGRYLIGNAEFVARAALSGGTRRS